VSIHRYAYGRYLNNSTHTNIPSEMIAVINHLMENPAPPERNNIFYTHNEYGFRANAFDEDITRAAFGCSHTYGFELEAEHTWPSQCNAYNFGVTGASAQTVARLVSAWIPDSNVKEVYILMPDKARREVFNPITETYSNIVNFFLPSLISFFPEYGYSSRKYSLSTEEQILLFLEKHPELNVLDEQQNEEVYADSVQKILEACGDRKLVIRNLSDAPVFDGEARDRKHNGYAWNRKVSRMFVEERYGM
jgi:hypothetical protein